MMIDRHNHEGYPDPTAYEALTAVMLDNSPAYRPLVFICSPYAGDIEHNVQNARRYSRFALSRGVIPIAPHLLFPQFMDDADEDERQLGLFMGRVLLLKCKELWWFGDRVTDGMAKEIEKAKRLNIPVRCFTHECREVTNHALP